MYDVLMWILEWKTIFIVPLYIVLPVLILWLVHDTEKKTPPPDELWGAISFYWVFGVFFCILIVDDGFEVSSFLILKFPDSPGAIFISFIANMLVSAFFFYSIYLFESFQQRGLLLAKIMTASFAPYSVIYFFMSYFLAGFFSDMPLVDDAYKERGIITTFTIYCAFSIPWLVYLVGSSKIHAFWQQIDGQT